MTNYSKFLFKSFGSWENMIQSYTHLPYLKDKSGDRARSIVENARYKDNWSCDWLSVENIIRFDRSVMTYKIRNKLSPESFWDKFQQRSLQSNYATRSCRDLQIPRLNTEHAKKSYRYSAIEIWNDIADIPVAIRELPTIIRFKKELKEYLKS